MPSGGTSRSAPSAGLIESLAAAGAPIAPGDAVENLSGLVVPGFADAHSHVFHRALRGLTHNDGGTFWTWRDLMYSLADRLNPDTPAGVGLRQLRGNGVRRLHLRRGVPLPAPPAGRAVATPNRTRWGWPWPTPRSRRGSTSPCWTSPTWPAGSARRCRRCSSGSPTAPFRTGGSGWRNSPGSAARRAGGRRGPFRPRRARPRSAGGGRGRPRRPVCTPTCPSSTRRTQAALAATGLTPTQLLAEAGALGPAHGAGARHPPDQGRHRRDRPAPVFRRHLPDDGGRPRGRPADRSASLALAGARLTLGGDQQVIVDPFAQARGLEYGERLSVRAARGVRPGEVAGHGDRGNRTRRSAHRAACWRSVRPPTWWRSAPTAREPPAPTRDSW